MATRILASLAVASVFLSASPASAGYREAAYVTTLYSDATYTTVVGHIYPECGFRYVQYHLVGTYSYFAVDEFVGYCTENGWEPL
ncbi:hypothetical protein D7X55_12445 [Corallococcus sp. AB049A]|uniref:Uncharacterized protein n=1 Tax=Corallococcus interemptor TaxID=2316720 RepID=A0A3A8QLG8_9BACT|nr:MULTISPECIES: hypothetical protein [Corallococcus]RKH48964.1 hypothetical protein D7Y23_18490 [Corallococcus sp. AB050B]RKH69523.1 hypothetical protein D7X96_14620 [Corallococcus interemptor]RKI68313.1 hypothetical protein D7X55_12445 [Corallococcus sp. AB049A]